MILSRSHFLKKHKEIKWYRNWVILFKKTVMEAMSIEEIIKSGTDTEIKKYQILSAIKSHAENFRKNRLYPSLTELVTSAVILENMTQKALHSINENEENIFSENLLLSDLEFETGDDEFAELINWSIYYINKILDDGIALFEFAENNIRISKICGCHDNDTGYLIVPDLELKQVNIYKFDPIIFTTASVPVTSIKTKLLRSFTQHELLSKPSEPAIKILRNYINDTNAAIFFCHTNIELPYENTVFPVAKKNLLKLLSE